MSHGGYGSGTFGTSRAAAFASWLALWQDSHKALRRRATTIVSLIAIHPNPGVKWDEMQKQIKKGSDLARKHGAENVTVLATTIGGSATNTIVTLSTSDDWTKFGQVRQALMDDPKVQEFLLEAGQIATWETYVSQTIPDI